MTKIRKHLKNLSRNQVTSIPEKQKISTLDFIKIVAYLLPISGILLTVLGYGRITGLATRFGFTALELVDDKADFLYESALPLMQLYSLAAEVLMSPIFWTVIFFMTGIGLIFYIIIRCLRSSPKRRGEIKAKLEGLDSFFEASAFDLGPVAGFFKATWGILSGISTLTLGLLMPLWVITAVLLIGLSGYNQGKKLANDYIIKPKACAGTLTDESNKEKVAICVAVFNGEKEVVRGRVIATTKERIFLYIKGAGNTRISKSYPIRNAIIERVDIE